MNKIISFTFFEKIKLIFDLFVARGYDETYTFKEWKEDINYKKEVLIDE